MKITIDNLDGRGAVDYSSALCSDHSLTGDSLKIERVLNAPSRASGMLDLSGSTLAAPVRRARVVIASDNGTVEILQGLNEGDRVVIDGSDRLREGAEVRVVESGENGQAASPASPEEPPQEAQSRERRQSDPEKKRERRQKRQPEQQ